MSDKLLNIEVVRDKLIHLNQYMINSGLKTNDLKRCYECIPKYVKGPLDKHKYSRFRIFGAIFISLLVCLLASTHTLNIIISYILGIRCFLPNNYLVWEATRPISDCSFCEGVTKPIILYNATKDEFKVRYFFGN